MRIRLKFFATLRDQFKTSEREMALDGPKKAQEIFCSLFEDPKLAERWSRSTRFAVNCEYVPPETLVHDGDELAFIPPVSGG